MPWNNLAKMDVLRWKCGHCDNVVAEDHDFYHSNNNFHIYICPGCEKPSFRIKNVDEIIPGNSYGNDVLHLPPLLSALYKEVRNCYSVGSFTSSVLGCRKMLMNVSVTQGDTPGKSFVEYIEYLSKNNYIPPNGKAWVDYIRKKGNEATHEIAVMTQEDAAKLITFTEMLLKFIYEFPKTI